MFSIERLRNIFRRDAEAIVAQIAQPRFATVASVDPANHAVRLTLQPEGVLTGWVPDASAFATGGGYGLVSPLNVGDQVHVSFAHGDSDNPVITGRLFSTADMPPVSPVTGKAIQPGEVGIFTPGAFVHVHGGNVDAQCTSFNIKAAAAVLLDAPSVQTTGNLAAGTGATGTFTSASGAVITVQDGIIVNID